jgi:hypothetical protein
VQPLARPWPRYRLPEPRWHRQQVRRSPHHLPRERWWRHCQMAPVSCRRTPQARG